MCEPVIFCFYRLGEKELDDLLAGIQLRCSSGPEGVLPKGQILKQILYYIKNLRVYLSRRVLLVLKRAPEGQVGSKIECNPGSIHDCWLSLLRHWQGA